MGDHLRELQLTASTCAAWLELLCKRIPDRYEHIVLSAVCGVVLASLWCLE